jgi:hypothetical protein
LVAGLAKSLAETAPDGRSRLFHLFTPEKDTRALFGLVTPLIRNSSFLGALAAILKAALSMWQIAVAVVPFTVFDSGSGSGLRSFLTTLFNTARFWSDNQNVAAPGVRDRVVHIALREDEGGLNLDMNSKVIEDLDLPGRAAGLLISARFDPSAKVDPETGSSNQQGFPNHRWVRCRNFMAALEDLSLRFATARRKSDLAANQRGESTLDTMIAGQAVEQLGYPAPAGARPCYHATTEEYEKLSLKMADAQRQDPSATFDRRSNLGMPAGRIDVWCGTTPEIAPAIASLSRQ